MFGNKRVWIGLLVTFLFLGLFLRQVEFARIGEALWKANLLYLLPAVPLYFAGVWFRAERWRHLLAPLRAFSARRLFPYVVIGYMANDVLPMRAGELVRAYIMGERQGVGKTPVLGTIALERIFDGVALLGFMAAIALFIPLVEWLDQILKLMALLFLGTLAALFLVLLSRERTASLMRLVSRILPARFRSRVLGVAEGFLDGLTALQDPRRVTAVLLYAVLAWLCEAGVFYFVGLALGLTSPVYLYVLAMAVANLATILPSSQAGIGPFEYFCAETFVVFGTDASLAAAFAVLVHAVLIVPVVALGLVYLWLENLSLAQVIRGAGVVPVAQEPSLRRAPLQE